MNLPGLAATLVLLLWQAFWQAALLLVGGWWLSRSISDARRRSCLLHWSIVGCLLVPAASLLLPHLIVLPAALSGWFPLVDAAPPAEAAHLPLAGWLAMFLVAVWMGGAAFQIIRIAAGWIGIRRVLSLSVPCQDERLVALLGRNDGDRLLKVRLLAGLHAPFCWQIHRPVIVLPENLLARSDEELELLLRHELAHLRAGDPLQLFVEQLLLAALWFHPLVWRGIRLAQRWREFACDDWAVAAGGSPKQFATLLTCMAERSARPRSGAWELSSLGELNDLQARLLRLLRPSPSPHPAIAHHAALVLLATFALVLTTVRLAGPWAERPEQRWLHWPILSGPLLDLVGVQVVDFDLQRAQHDPQEQSPEHRSDHRHWRGR
jgi:beta-lactamase regulating signal transducer with metallopeptidase domain